MSTGKNNIQDPILNLLRKNRIPLVIFLVNGVPLKGIIRSFDNFTILLMSEGDKQSLIYKHAISTIVFDSDLEIPTDVPPQEDT